MEPLHLGVTKVKTSNERGIVHGIQMSEKALGVGAGGGGSLVLFGVPIPHIFRRDLDTCVLGVGEEPLVHLGVFFGTFGVDGMNDADLAARLCRAFNGANEPLEHRSRGEGGVRLIANDAALLTDMAKLARKGKILLAV